MKINKVKIKNAEGRFEEHEIGIDANNIQFSTTENAEQVIAAQNNNTSELDLQYQILEKEYNTSTPIEDYDLVRNIDKFEARLYDDEINKIKVAKIKKSDGSWGEEIELEAKSTGIALNNNKDAEDEITMLKNKVAALENIEKTLTPKLAQQTEEGKSLSIIGINEDKDYDFKILGESKQETRSGKNLLIYPYSNTTTTTNGITFTDNGDGTIIANGTATANALFWLADNRNKIREKIINKRITLSGCPSGGSNSTYRIQIYNANGSGNFVNDTGNGATATFTNESSSFNVVIVVFSGTTLNNVLFKPMLEISDSKTEWEPYGEMPSPEYPSEVESCGDNINLCNAPYRENNKLTITATQDDYYTILNYYAYLEAGKKYRVSFESDGSYGMDSGTDTVQIFLMKDKSFDTIITIFSKNEIISPTVSGNYYIRADVNKNGKSHSFWNFKIKEGSTASPYSPYGQGCMNEVICNKNLAKIEASGKYRSYIDGILTDLSSFNSYIFKVSSQIYMCSWTGKASEVSNLCFFDKDMNFISGLEFVDSTTNRNIIINNNKIKYATIAVSKDITEFQIEPGSTATPYQEHKEQVYTIPTQQPFRAIGDIRDTFIKKDGKRYERHYISRKIFDGTESFELSSQEDVNQYRTTINFLRDLLTSPDPFKLKGVALSNYFIKLTNANELKNIGFTLSGLKQVVFNTNFETVAEFKSWLSEKNSAGTPLYIDYILETPLDIECTEEQTKQLNKLYNEILSYDTRHIILEDKLGNNYIEYYPDYSKPIVSNIEF